MLEKERSREKNRKKIDKRERGSNSGGVEHDKFKVLRDLPAKVREKVLRQQDMTLEAMTTLVAESEAMDIINPSLKPDQHKLPPSKGKTKEEAMTTVEKHLKKKTI